jgi:hypothetical protein
VHWLDFNKGILLYSILSFTHYFHLFLTCICLKSRLFRMTLVTAQAPHITAHFVTSHRGCGGGVGKQWTLFIIVGVDVACQQCTECWVLPWKYNLQCCRAEKYLALLLTTISLEYYEFVSLLFGMENVSCYCNSKLPKTYIRVHDPVLSSLKMEGIRLSFSHLYSFPFFFFFQFTYL